ncbi:MAG: acyl-protein synthetase [Candidatus Aenigmarchaeota archaeon]|nr:acyl-protein synthetase [Candidatus Aenigmarchaeota archaeon]
MDENEAIQNLISSPQYEIKQIEKERILLEIVRIQVKKSIESNSKIKSMYSKLGMNVSDIKKLSDLPYIPVQMFKHFNLAICKKEDIVRIVKSSSTTGQSPSIIPLDKETSLRQTRALASTLRNFLGTERMPFLVIDSENVNKKSIDLSARGAAVRGLSSFAKSITYCLKDTENGMEIDLEKLEEFVKINEGKDVFIFGFTFIIWINLVQKLKSINKNLDCNFGKATLFHSGGWKKLNDMKVSEDIFSSEVAEVFNTEKEQIHNFYGMAEQTGVIFVDCEMGFKHVPNFADIIIRDIQTLEEAKIGNEGLIEVINVLGSSYPSQAILTEDVGNFAGIDDCKCGRRGKYFVFQKRVEKTELRGCGDIFAKSRETTL